LIYLNTKAHIDNNRIIPYNKGKDTYSLPYEVLMQTAKVTSKGQITLPKNIRDTLGVHPGESIGFEEKDGLIFVQKIVPRSPFDKWVGKLSHQRGKQTDDMINELRGE
jgi:AbrB family looped-hinge helix DNA binding protein